MGWTGYAPGGRRPAAPVSLSRPGDLGAGDGRPLRPEPADVLRLGRRLARIAVSAARAARADETPTLNRLLGEHLGVGAASPPVVGGSWPAYEHVNVDGLSEDVDVAFLLTTNRADLLEPALADRPGRVDQAVEIPLPDAEARRRLVELYRGTLRLEAVDFTGLIERTEGVTASFLKELLRRAALISATAGDAPSPLVVTGVELGAALDQLLAPSNRLTRALLGGGSAT